MILTSCAQQPKPNYYANDTKTDLGSRLDISVDYIADDIKALCVVYVSNPKQRTIRLWQVIENATDGQRVISYKRFYTGNDKTYQQAFRMKPPAPDIKEKLHVEAYDGSTGKLLLATEPVKTAKTGGQNRDPVSQNTY